MPSLMHQDAAKRKGLQGPMAENTSHLDDLLRNVTLGLPCQGIGRDVPRSQRGPPMGNTKSPILRGYKLGFDPQESLENTINTMGTLLGVHPIVL